MDYTDEQIGNFARLVFHEPEHDAGESTPPGRTEDCLSLMQLWEIAVNPKKEEDLGRDDRAHLAACSHCQHNLDFARQMMWHPSSQEILAWALHRQKEPSSVLKPLIAPVAPILKDEDRMAGIRRHLEQLSCRECQEAAENVRAWLQRPDVAAREVVSLVRDLLRLVQGAVQRVIAFPSLAAAYSTGQSFEKELWLEEGRIRCFLHEVDGDLAIIAETKDPTFQGRFIEVCLLPKAEGERRQESVRVQRVVLCPGPKGTFIAQATLGAMDEIENLGGIGLAPEDQAHHSESVPVQT